MHNAEIHAESVGISSVLEPDFRAALKRVARPRCLECRIGFSDLGYSNDVSAAAK